MQHSLLSLFTLDGWFTSSLLCSCWLAFVLGVRVFQSALGTHALVGLFGVLGRRFLSPDPWFLALGFALWSGWLAGWTLKFLASFFWMFESLRPSLRPGPGRKMGAEAVNLVGGSWSPLRPGSAASGRRQTFEAVKWPVNPLFESPKLGFLVGYK